MQADHCNIHAVYNDLASRRLNDSKQTQSERRFTSTSSTNQSNLSATELVQRKGGSLEQRYAPELTMGSHTLFKLSDNVNAVARRPTAAYGVYQNALHLNIVICKITKREL